MLNRMQAAVAVVAVLLAAAPISADVPRPRGVSLAKASLYHPRSDQSWMCLDGSKSIRFVQINDDYCDCPDGSDEPGTAACGNGRFHCANLGYRSQDIPSSRVNDGICDCCDASDEYAVGVGANCRNSCNELGRAEQQQRKTEAELHKRGAAKRAEMIARGKQLKTEREVRRAELEGRRLEQETLKAEKEQLKNVAEAAEAEALEVYKEQQREQEAAAAEAAKADEGGAQQMRAEAEASFAHYDHNKDGFVEITELQVDMKFDRDHNNVVTVDEAKFFLDERERMDLETFVALAWPRIKPIQMLSQGLFEPPAIPEEHNEEAAQRLEDEGEAVPPGPEAPEGTNDDLSREHAEDFETEEEDEGYDDEEEGDADVGVGSVTETTAETNTPQPEYDPETQRLIELANGARNAHSEVERELREIEHEIKEIDDQTAKNYGLHEEWASMDGECYTFEDREYVYSLCPFERAAQKQRSGGAETTLGRWDQWISVGDNQYAKQKYAHGASCWNGPQRSAMVELRCALEHRIISVSEPNRCEYVFEFETPAACDELGFAAKEEEQRAHDEL